MFLSLVCVGSISFTGDLSAPPESALDTIIDVPNDEPDRYNIEDGVSFSLTCVAEGPNDFELTLWKDGVEVTSPLPSVATETLSMPLRMRKTLNVTFSSFSASDNGVYQCNASNAYTTVSSRSVLLGSGKLQMYWRNVVKLM